MVKPSRACEHTFVATKAAEIRIPEHAADTRPIAEQILSKDAIDFLTRLHREVEPTRQGLLDARRQRWQELRSGGTLRFPEETADQRAADWRVATVPHDLQVR